MIFMAGDHYAFPLVERIVQFLSAKDIDHENMGARSADEPVTLQQIIPAVIERVRQDPSATGVLICGTGAGVEIGANRFHGIRASLCVTPEQAKNARIYDNGNVLCLGSWLTEDPAPILEAWLSHEFDGMRGGRGC